MPLVNRSNSPVHHPYKPIVCNNSVFAFGRTLTIYAINSLMSHIPKINTNIALKKFIDTAILSGESQNHDLMGCMSEKKNAI